MTKALHWTTITGIYALSIALSYGSDMAPFYVKLLAGRALQIIGPMTRFEEPCRAPPRGDVACKTQYRIPAKYLRSNVTGGQIGLGIILHPIDVSCDTGGQATQLHDVQETGRAMAFFNQYQTLDVSAVDCQADLIVRNWVHSDYRRYGYLGAPAVIGRPNWVTKTKELAEFFQGNLSTLLLAICSMLWIATLPLTRLAHSDLRLTEFEPYFGYWLAFMAVTGNALLVLLPVSFPYILIPRISNTCSLIVLVGSCLQYIAREAIPSRIRKAAATLIERPLSGNLSIPPFVLLAVAIQLSPYFSSLFSPILLAFGAGTFLISIVRCNLLMALFSTTLVSDALKIMMIHGLPASRLSHIFVGLVLIFSYLKKIRLLEATVRKDASIDLARQVAHDIRSPVAALNVVLQDIGDVPEDKRILLQSAAQRIKDIASGLLRLSLPPSKTPTHEPNASPIQVTSLVSSLISEKRLQYRSLPNISIDLELGPGSDQTYVIANAADFQRALSNLINNSVEALSSHSGRVIVSLYCSENHVQIEVRDNGSGIPQNILQEITKDGISYGKDGRDSGFGLGLAQARNFVASTKGAIHITSSPGTGTTAKLTLPKFKN